MFDDDDEFDLTPEERALADELCVIFRDLDTEQAALEKLEHDDPVGLAMFGDRDDWVDARLHPKDAPQ